VVAVPVKVTVAGGCVNYVFNQFLKLPFLVGGQVANRGKYNPGLYLLPVGVLRFYLFGAVAVDAKNIGLILS